MQDAGMATEKEWSRNRLANENNNKRKQEGNMTGREARRPRRRWGKRRRGAYKRREIDEGRYKREKDKDGERGKEEQTRRQERRGEAR
jgi:hypothetical protein